MVAWSELRQEGAGVDYGGDGDYGVYEAGAGARAGFSCGGSIYSTYGPLCSSECAYVLTIGLWILLLLHL